jgi:hypothetical protein
MYVSTLEFAGNGPKRGNGPRCVLCVQNARQTPVQNGVLGLEKQLQLFLLFYAPKWPLLSIHTLKSAVKYVSNVQFMCVISQNSRHGIRLFIFLFTSRDLPNYLYVPVQPQDIKDIGDFL